MGKSLRSSKIVRKKTRSWSRKEDEILKNYIRKNGIGPSWKALATNTGLQRSTRSCRARWLNYLQPGVNLGCFTEEEEDAICALYREIGSRWSVISAHLPGRSDQAVKNHWNTTLKRKSWSARISNKFDSDNGIKELQIADVIPAMEPGPDFCELVNWYVMTPPHDTWDVANATDIVSWSDDEFCNGQWWR